MEGDSPADGTRLLVLGAGPAQIGLLQAAHARGLYVVAADRDARAPAFRYADRRAIISVEDEEGLDRLASAERIEGIIAPGLDFPLAIAARIARRLGLAHPLDPQTAQLAASRLRQREVLEGAGVPQVRSSVCASLDQARAAADEVGRPCVVMAPDRQGEGLAVVEDEAGLAEAFRGAFEAARGNVVLVEELLTGPEVTVNAFSVNGRFHPLTVTDRVRATSAGRFTLAHVWPSELETEVLNSAVAVAAAAAEALGVSEGPTCTRVHLGPDGPAVGELAARLGRAHDAELCEAALGIDLNALALAAALGKQVSLSALAGGQAPGPGRSGRGACVRFLVAPPGTLSSIDGLDSAQEADGVVWARAYREPGFTFREQSPGGNLAGAVLAVGGSRGQALERAKRAADRIRLVTGSAEALV